MLTHPTFSKYSESPPAIVWGGVPSANAGYPATAGLRGVPVCRAVRGTGECHTDSII
ncbi:MAG: hypothetical protein MUC60_05820 [Oscillatoria sp. Prado101]|nr:hypothetical protein [Oscillatoria sp. Prado101]